MIFYSKIQAKRRFLFLAIVALLTFSFYGNVSANTAYTGMRNITALQLTADMGTGWNLGNTLDAPCGETCWGNPVTTQAMIDEVKAQGFKTIRIPTTWGTHVGGAPNYTIDAAWLDRVETVCNYAFANDMYVILNTHHEGDWCKPTYADEAVVTAELVAIWTQIANRFKNYGDYLILETLNEPRLEGSREEWSGGTAEGRDVVNNLNKAAVDAIRATGGNNSSRFIMCPPYAAAGIGVAADDYVIPNNDNKVIVSVHNYSPYHFCLNDRGTSTFDSEGEATLDYEMGTYYNQWISQGRAVVIGEWGSIDKNNTSDRTAHASYFVQAAQSKQLPVVLWDNGYSGQYGLAQLNRTGLSWYFPTIVDAVTSPFNGGCTPTAIIPYIQIDGGSLQQTASASVTVGGSVMFSPQPATGGSWSWSGPNGFNATTRDVAISNIQTNQAGDYIATYTNDGGCESFQTFTVTVTAGGGEATTAHVQSIFTGTENVGRGNKRGTATITIYDDLGTAVSGATVTGTFSGSFNETVSGTTDSNGTVVLVTNGTAKGKITVDFCVSNVTHSSLTYAPEQDVITCTGAAALKAGVTSIKDEDQIDYEIYPNPTSDGNFHITFHGIKGTVTIAIYNIQGKLLYKQFETGKEHIVVNTRLVNGLYLVKVQSETSATTRRLVVK